MYSLGTAFIWSVTVWCLVYLSCIDDCLEQGPDSVVGSAGGQSRSTAAPPILPICLYQHNFKHLIV
jgi:hypothetical protein